MKFGILLTAVHGRDSDPKIQLAEHREMVELAEQLGFDAMVAGQHFLGKDLRYYQPIQYLTYMQQFAPTLAPTLGIILLSLVNPIELAEQIALLDVTSGGKAVLGLGLGYSDHEFRAFGIAKEQRVKRFEEGVEIIKLLWSGEEVSYDGRFFKLENELPSVVPLSRPPLWIAGQGEPAVRRAARIGDAWYPPPFPTHEGLRRLRDVFLEERAKAGLSLETAVPIRRELVIGPSRAEARQMAAERSQARYKTYLNWGLGHDLDKDNKGFGSQADEDIDGRFLLGTGEEVAEQLAQLRDDIGMTHFNLKPQWQGMPHVEAMRQIEKFGTEVIPRLRGKA